jgi:hypothetical protein
LATIEVIVSHMDDWLSTPFVRSKKECLESDYQTGQQLFIIILNYLTTL